MNQTFDINRFGKLLQSELLINRNTIGKALLALVLALLAVYYLWLYVVGLDPQLTTVFSTAPNAYSFVVSNFEPILWIIIFLSPLFLYYNLYDKVKSVSLAMLPASKLEKFLSAIVQVGVLLPALLIAVFGVFLLIVHPISFPNYDANWGNLFSSWFRDAFYHIGLQSFLFLGVFWFKENKIRKLILSLIAGIVLLSVMGYIITTPELPVHKLFKNMFANDFGKFLYDNRRTIFRILFPLVPWIIAYNKFVRTQI